MTLHDAWTALRHGGNLLAPAALDGLLASEAPPWGLADRLRSALVALGSDKATPESLGPLLDTVLEDACGLRDGWQKGSALGAGEAEKLLDGTAQKPRRRWTGPGGEVLVVFTTTAPRIGIGKGRRPAAQVVEYLRRRALPLGLVTNGRQWRLVWADTDSLAWAEWEAERWLAADQLSDELAVLRRILSPAALTRADADHSPLLAAIRDTRRGQAKLSKELGERVRRAVETLLKSRQPLLGPAWDDHREADVYVAACHFVMRLVVTLFAEARELLPAENPIFHQAYGLRGLLDQLDRLTPERRRSRYMAWPRVLALFRLLHRGSPHPAITLPAYGGDLFRPGDPEGDGVQRALALLEALPEPPDDDVIHRVLVLLTRTTQKVREGSGWRSVATPVDFTELTSEYIGILYEGLLDYELHRAGDEPVLFLNLGDQPALPLDRLEEMDDKALAALVEKAKVKKQAASTEEDGGGDAAEDEDAVGFEDAEADGDDQEDEADPSSEGPQDLILDGGTEGDDARSAARTRAIRWGRRAADVGKLVKKPRASSADARAAWEAQLDSAAEQLVADVKLPGEMYLVRWGGTRKGAGTFYTRPQITLPTVRRTLEPLVSDPAADGTRTLRLPEALLSLKVCDPAMGSGSFLVAALRVLTETVVESLHVHERIERVNGRCTVRCELLPEADRSLPSEGFEERLEAIARRAVVEHCLYGVDIDPLAVELARVALWVETLDRRLPFTFLDHKLRCGDALVGTWLDRFRDYPLLCFDRQSPDWTQKKDAWKLVHHPWRVWHQALKERRAEAIADQVELLTGQRRLDGPLGSDEELKAAVDRVRCLYRDLRAVPAGRPDERARVFRERIQTDAALAKVREAFDTWCALWFWPLDQLDAMPLPRALPAPGEATRAVVKTLTDRHRFFHWELEFPDVFTEEGAGFHAVVGNPPWEIQKPNSKEFFSNHDPLYRGYGKQEALRVQRALFEARPTLEAEWLAYLGDFKDRGNFVKHAAEPFGDGKAAEHEGGDVSLVRGNQGAALHRAWRGRRARYRGLSDSAQPFRHQGSADLNTYKMFVEAGHALLRTGGQLGLVVPSGLYTDKGTGALRRLLLNDCCWRWLYGFENRNKLFDIDSRFKFCVAIAEKGGRTVAIQAAFMRHDLEDWADASGALDYPAERVTAFSPRSLSILELRDGKDVSALARQYSSGHILADGMSSWTIRCSRELHMTDDSRSFIALSSAAEYQRMANGQCLVDGVASWPLAQGVSIDAFNPHAKRWVEGAGLQARWEPTAGFGDDYVPQYVVAIDDVASSGKIRRGWKVAYGRIGNATNARTMLATVLYMQPAGDSIFLLYIDLENPVPNLALASILNSYAYDYGLRQRVGGTNLSWFFLSESAVPHTGAANTLQLYRLACRLNMASTQYAHSWEVAEGQAWQRLWAVTGHERLRLRCMLDAIVAALYGLDRDDVGWILKDCDHPKTRLADKAFCRRLDPKGFWRVGKSEEPELRHTVLSLAAFDDLQAAIADTGDRDAGIETFCAQHDGDGWMLPDTLRLTDLALTRTVDVCAYDERARIAQPVRSRLGKRFLDWQLAQIPVKSWAECERHAQALREGMPERPVETLPSSLAEARQETLFGPDHRRTS